MDEVLIEVFVPVLSESFDVFIPRYSPMYEVLELIKKAISDLSYGRFVSDDNTVLCYRKSGQILNINLSVCELNVLNGSKLMLI